MFLKRPILLNQIAPDVSTSLAMLTGIDGLARSILMSVLPLAALAAFGSKDAIASVYFASTIFTLIFTLNLATLERLLNRRGLVTLGALFLILAAIFFYTESAPLFAAGVSLRAAGASIFSVCMSLYIMDYIGKKELTQNESRRMLFMAGAWLIGPALGGWLYENGNELTVYLISGSASIAMLAYFWWLRLGDDKVIQAAAQSASKNPINAIKEFMKQPRLRIAYFITLSRACFWVTVFVYGPIYIIEAGLPAWLGGILLSGVSSLLFLSPVIRRLADHFGTRQILIGCSIIIGTNMLAIGLLGEPRPLGLLFIVLGSFGGVGMDVLVNIPFLRMVKPRQRTEMTAVFTTWRESASLLTQALVFLTLLIAPFWVFYLILGGIQFAAAVATSYLPRRL